MPYIKQERREALSNYDRLRTAGELNYQITKVLIKYLKGQGLSYQTCNDVVGALDNAKHEFQRRIQDSYEDQAIERNGDVYDLQDLTRGV